MERKPISTDRANQDAWVMRLEDLLGDMKRATLAKELGISKSTITGWFRGIKSGPSIQTFASLADRFNVSLDYLWGRDKCKRPENEEIHKLTGLSDRAINNLKETNRLRQGRGTNEKIIAICNFLLEGLDCDEINSAILFDNLYDYLFGDFSLQQANGEEITPAYLVSKISDEKSEKTPYSDYLFSQAHLVNVQDSLAFLKRRIHQDKMRRNEVEE